jgi:transcriptional regulator with XRE-family HTH domain
VLVGLDVNPKHPKLAGVPKSHSSTLDKLSQRLRELRRRHNITQEEFAGVAGLSYKFYQQIESGHKKQIWLETVERLAAGYGLEAWALLAPEPPRKTALAKKPRRSNVHYRRR